MSIQEFFDENSPSGLQDLKVHQINNESDKKYGFQEKKTQSISQQKQICWLASGRVPH